MLMNEILTNLSQQEIIGLTLIGEARGEPIEGQVAVASVIRNRLHTPNKYSNYKDVCLAPKQFSCWNEDDPNYVILVEIANKMISGQKLEDPYLRQCILVANGIYDWAIRDNTNGSRNYLTTNLFNSDKKPSWAKKATNMTILGKHTFFNI